MLLAVYAPAALLAFGQGLLLTTLPLYAATFDVSYGLISLVVARGGARHARDRRAGRRAGGPARAAADDAAGHRAGRRSVPSRWPPSTTSRS